MFYFEQKMNRVVIIISICSTKCVFVSVSLCVDYSFQCVLIEDKNLQS